MQFEVSGSLHASPRVLAIPRSLRMAALGLWVTAGSWCAGQGNGGVVPAFMLGEFGVSPDRAHDLVDAGLWEYAPDGFRFVRGPECGFSGTVAKRAGTARSKRGTRIEPGWMPSPELIAQMREECPAVNLEAEHRVFLDYWIAQPGQKGVKLDWAATWRNWMRRKQGEAPRQPRPAQQLRQSPVDRARDVAAELRALEEGR